MLLVLMRYTDDLEKLLIAKTMGFINLREAVCLKPVTQLEIVITVPTRLDKPSIFYMLPLYASMITEKFSMPAKRCFPCHRDFCCLSSRSHHFCVLI